MTEAGQRAFAELDTETMLAFLQRLVQTPSVYLPGVAGANETAAARLVFEQLQAWGWEPIWEEVVPGRPNIIADLPGAPAETRLLLFEGHTDVVTPGDRAAWQYEPFGGEIVGGRMYGRGTADMKGGLAAMLFAARALQRAGVPPGGRIRLLIPCDEEGLMLGIKQIVAHGYAAGASGAIICEPEEREVCLAQKGALRLRLKSFGRVAHGAMPREGVNALAGMIRLLARVMDLETELQSRHGSHPLLGLPYITPTVIRAPLNADPAQMNVLPDQCDVFLDIRTVPAIDHAGLIGVIQVLMNQARITHPEYRFELEVIDNRPATEIAATHPLVEAVVAGHQVVYGEQPVFGGVPGSTDGTILVRDAGVPVVVYGPGNKRIPHQPDEFVELDEVVRAAQVYILAALRFLS